MLQGYEINPEEWTPAANLAEAKALDEWEKAKTGPAKGRSPQKVRSLRYCDLCVWP